MKNYRATLAMVLSIILCVCLFALPVMAQTTEHNGLEVSLTTDKAEYAGDEQITATLNVKNTGNDAFAKLTLQHQTPKGYDVVAGETEKAIESLAAGESASVAVTYKGGNPATGDATTLVVGLMVAAGAGLAALMILDKKSRMVGISMILCCVMLVGVAPAQAAHIGEDITVTTTVKVNGADVTLSAKVTQEVPVDPVVYHGMTASELDALPGIKADEFGHYMNVVWNFGWDNNPITDKIDFAGTAPADSKIWRLGKDGAEGHVIHDSAGWGIMMWTHSAGNTAYMYSKLDVPENVNEFRIWAAGLTNEQFSGSGAIRAVAWYKDENGNYVKHVMVPLDGLIVGDGTAFNAEDGTITFSNAQGWTIPGINNGDGMLIYDMSALKGKTDVVLFVETIGLGTVLGTADTQAAGGVPEGDGMPECVIIKRVMFL